MHKIYAENASLFRSQEMMTSLRMWGYWGYLLVGLLYVCIYSKGYQEGKSGAGQGVRFGLLMGLFFWGGQLLLSYPYMPLPTRIYLNWFAIGLFEFTLLGFVLGMLYKPKA